VPDVWFAIPGDPATLTGGYAYARRLTQALPAAGWSPHHVALPAEFPNPSAADLAATRDVFASLPAGTPVLVDGLAFGALPRDVLDDFDLTYVALVHHPLAQETGLSEADARRLKASEQAALDIAYAVVATSPHTATTLARAYNVAPDKIYVAPPGTDPAPRAVSNNAVPHLLTVATLTRRKGHDVLIAALATLQDLPWRSTIVGSLARDPEVTANIRAAIAAHGLQDRVTLRGELDGADLHAAYVSADIFALASRHEGYGMVFAEALARGLPIVACAAGAVVDTVPAEAGLLVPPDDPAAFAAALRRVLSDSSLRRQMSEAAWDHGRRLPTWSDTAAAVSEALWASVS